MRHLIHCTALCLLAAGCQEGIYLADDEGGHAGIDSGDCLSQPYAAGATVELSAHNLTGKGWKFVSDDPATLDLVQQNLDQDELTASAHAKAAGTARVRLVDANGEVHRDVSLLVVAADHARTFAHAPLRLLGQPGDSPDSAETAEAQVLVGGTGVFAIGYFQGTQRLYGHGLAAVDPLPGVDVQPKASSGLPVNEWIFVTPSVAGPTPIPLHAGAQVLGAIMIDAVPDTAITSLDLSIEDGKPSDGDKVWVAARARDVGGHDVFGADAGWTLDGALQIGEDSESTLTMGDLYRFRFDEGGTRKQLVATRGTITAAIDVNAKDGVVKNTTYLGCSAAPGHSEETVALLWVGVVIALARARRGRGSVRS